MKSRALIRTPCNAHLGRFLLFILLVALHSVVSAADTPYFSVIQAGGDSSSQKFMTTLDSASGVLYVARNGGMSLSLDTQGMVIALDDEMDAEHQRIRMVLDGGRQKTVLSAEDTIEAHEGITSVRRMQAYDGVDVKYYFKGNVFEYDFVVAPAVNPDQIVMRFEGASHVRLDERGGLLLYTDHGVIRHHPPYSYQLIEGVEQQVESRFVVDEQQAVRFELGEYDSNYQLVIDPAVTYAGYFGADNPDINTVAHDVATDAQGNIYITGQSVTTTTTLLGGLPVEDQEYGIFVAKLDPFGNVLFSSFFGTQGASSDEYEQGRSIAVDGQGRIYVTGSVMSYAGFRDDMNGDCSNGIVDAFLVVYVPDDTEPSGYRLDYSACLGGKVADIGEALAVDDAGNVYIVGSTIDASGKDFPLTIGALRTGNEARFSEAFLMRLSPVLGGGGYRISFSTLIGGTGTDMGHAVALGREDGVVYVAGSTSSVGMDAASNQMKGDWDGFVSKVSIQGTGWATLDYITYIGGEAESASDFIHSRFGVSLCGQWRSDAVCALDVSQSGDVYAVGSHVSGAGHLSLVDAAGQLLSSYAIGGGPLMNPPDAALGVALDEAGSVVSVVGRIAGDRLGPEAIGAFHGGLSDAFLSRYRVDGTHIYSAFLGGQADDEGRAVVMDDVSGNLYLAGVTRSVDFPVFPSGQQLIADAEAFVLGITIDFDEGRDLDVEFLAQTNNEAPFIILPDDQVGRSSVAGAGNALVRRSGAGGGWFIFMFTLVFSLRKVLR